jgi:hypothetical protein
MDLRHLMRDKVALKLERMTNRRPPDGRRCAARPLAEQMAATVDATVLAAAGMAMWALLADLGLVEHGDQLVVKDLLTRRPARLTCCKLAAVKKDHVFCESLF